MAGAVPWLDGSILCRGRYKERQGNGLVGIARDAQIAPGPGARAIDARRFRARRLSRRRGLLWHEWQRRCGGRCRAALARDGPARARAMDARGRTWLRPERPAAAF